MEWVSDARSCAHDVTIAASCGLAIQSSCWQQMRAKQAVSTAPLNIFRLRRFMQPRTHGANNHLLQDKSPVPTSIMMTAREMVSRVTPPMKAPAPMSAKAPGSIQAQGLGDRNTPGGALQQQQEGMLTLKHHRV